MFLFMNQEEHTAPLERIQTLSNFLQKFALERDQIFISVLKLEKGDNQTFKTIC